MFRGVIMARSIYSRKQQPLTQAKMFNATWTERDEAILVELLKRKIKEMRYEIRKLDSPYAKAKLRHTRAEYQTLLDKVQRGDYDPDILAAELKSYHMYSAEIKAKREKQLSKYADAYSDVDFDFEAYFSKSRYFGAALPIIMIVLILVFAALLISSVYLTPTQLEPIEAKMSAQSKLSLTSIGYFKLESGANDFLVPNNGEWPKGTFIHEEQKFTYGDVYVDDDAYAPDKVLLHDQLHMQSVDITVVDVIKALFRTQLFSKNRVDIIENLDAMQGPSWYYMRYIRDRADDIEIVKGEDGKYNNVAIVKRIATYGTIYSLVIMILACAVELFINVGRLFSFTSRRLHFWPILILICGILTLIFPAFLEIKSVNSADIKAAFSNYFTVNWSDFLYGESTITFNLLFAIFLVFPFLLTIMPFFFKNRPAKTVAYVPKGNRPHVYAGDKKATKAGQPGMSRVPKKGAYALAGSKPAYSPQTPNKQLPRRTR